MRLSLSGDTTKIAPPKMYLLNVTNSAEANSMNIHMINVTKNDTTIHAIVTPLDPENLLEVLLAYEDYPNDTHHIDADTLPHEDTGGNYSHKEMLQHTYFPDPELTAKAGIYRIAVRIRSRLHIK